MSETAEKACAEMDHIPFREVVADDGARMAMCFCGSHRFEVIPIDPQHMIDSTDATVWAREFCEHTRQNINIATDVGTMTAWFANAIEAGRRHEHDRDPF